MSKASKSNGKPLRFAALIRVSTERQEKQGESLRTQRTQIEAAVAKMGGTIVQRYAGQEHATSGWEREQRDKLLDEAEKARKPFDAVIVAHEDRWSRDDTRSGADLDRLRDAGVKFFVLDREQDLMDPSTRLYLGISAVVGGYHARNQRKKSIENKIERAKRGMPTAGKLPFARTYDKESGKWIINAEKHAMIRDIAERYLAGEQLFKLTQEYGQNNANICRCLRERCGETWIQKFRADDLGIMETVTTRVPRLLPEKMIRAVCERMDAKRTLLHGRQRREYLLGGRIRCALCGRMLTGMTKPYGTRYYRHCDKGGCELRPWGQANRIEAAVVRDLFNMFGNPAAIERAVKQAIPDCEKLLQQRERLESETAKIEKARARVLALIEKDAITDKQAETKLRELKEREAGFLATLDSVNGSLACLPDPEAARQAALQVHEICGGIVIEDKEGNQYAGGNDVQSFLMMSYEDRRKLIEAAFAGGKLPDGKPAGVYIYPPENTTGHRRYKYAIRGRLLGKATSGVMKCTSP
jgi:DNA invertase Pin-like site-specific DNA recombinase